MITSCYSLMQNASYFIKSEFNLELEKSQLKPYSSEDWKKFCKANNFDVDSSGIYVPVSYSAYIKNDSPFLIPNIFHELYGHGLFVEHSTIGKKLISIIQDKDDEQSFMINEINQKEQLFGIAKQNIHNYEGFAVWFEALLCNETGNSNIWNLKKGGLRSDYAKLFEFFL